LVQEKKFRLDLYYRLNVATIELPPLQARPEDIPLLARHFLSSFCRKYGVPVKTLEEAGLKLLREYHWPGNIRQLKNLLERLVVLTDCDVISAQEISASLLLQPQLQIEADLGDGKDVSGSLSLGSMEERYIRTALKLAAGNQRRAAELLHITLDTLRYRLKKMGIKSK
ncbi:MAG: helix-turn-helix domain-containing protein, partial [Deltaproteobacteria bacterium]